MWLEFFTKDEAMEFSTQIKLMLQIQKECCYGRLSLANDIVRLVKENLKIADFEEEHVVKRIQVLYRDPILSTRVEQINTIIEKYKRTDDSFEEFNDRVEKLQEDMRTESKIYKNLQSISNLETLERMPIESVKVVVGAWNKRLQFNRKMQATMDGLFDEWNQHHIQQGYEECARLIDTLLLQN